MGLLLWCGAEAGNEDEEVKDEVSEDGRCAPSPRLGFLGGLGGGE